MSFEVLFQGVVVGFLASIGLGPVTVMCLQRAVSKPFPSGFVSGLGSAVGDTVFAVLAWFFVAIVAPFLETNLMVIKIASGVCILAVGLVFFFRNPVKQISRDRAQKTGLWQDFISIFALTLSNPAVILWQLVVFSAIGVAASSGAEGGLWTGVQVIFGYFCGAAVWWWLLTGLVGRLRGRFSMRHLVWIKKGASAAITLFGLVAIISAFV